MQILPSGNISIVLTSKMQKYYRTVKFHLIILLKRDIIKKNEYLINEINNFKKEKTLLRYEINQKEIIEYQKMIYIPQIAEFLDNYENNRKKYKTLDDFIPELEKFIEGLE